VNPGDAAVAARSFPRRRRSLFATVADDDAPDEVLAAHGSGSPSALALGQRAAEVLASTAERLARIRREHDPVLSGDPPPATHGTTDDVLAAIEAAADELARTIDSIDAGDWQRPATLDGGATDAIGVVTGGVERAASLLRQAERVLDDVRAGR
jgi:hypothetical protein